MEKVGDSISTENASWSFAGDEVAKHFDAHVSKSVPLYDMGHELVCKISDFFLQDQTTCYELGCSTAKLTSLLAKRHEKKKVRFIGIDREEGMIKQAKSRFPGSSSVELVCGDLNEIPLEPADLIISYYTIQFTRPQLRQSIINKIYESLRWGGAFVLFEKVRGPDARFQDMMSAIYTDYKLDQGYNSEEIISKSRSLKGVLEPFSSRGNIDLLTRAGFSDVMTVMKYVCFEGFLAIK